MTKQLVTLGAAAWFSICLCHPGQAVDEADRPVADNSGKQLATVNPLLRARSAAALRDMGAASRPVKNIYSSRLAKTAAQGSVLQDPRALQTNHHSWAADLRQRCVSCLKDLDQESLDVMQVVSARLRRFVCIRVNELWQWFAELYRQVTSTPTVTPFGSPYVHNRNWPGSFNPISDNVAKMLADFSGQAGAR